VLAGGDGIEASLASDLPDGCRVVAADSGLVHAAPLDLDVDVVIGDMDSVPPALLQAAEARGVEILRYPADKDATDLDLALTLVQDRPGNRVIVVGGHGGRLDHLLANALLLTSDRYADLEISWWFGDTRIAVVRPRVPAVWAASRGDLVTLLAVGEVAGGVTTQGLRWPLTGDDLPPGSTRGVSNIVDEVPASVSIDSGILLAIHERNSP
jgi:thiamine pyrophosphokinase